MREGYRENWIRSISAGFDPESIRRAFNRRVFAFPCWPPCVVFAVPMSVDTRDLYERYVIPTYSRFDLRLARGEGTQVWDEAGKRYLDFGAGIAVTSIGH